MPCTKTMRCPKKMPCSKYEKVGAIAYFYRGLIGALRPD